MHDITEILHSPVKLPTLSLSKSNVTQIWPYLAIITAHLVWGTNFIVTKVTLAEIPPMSLAFSRFFLALLLLLPFLAVEREKLKIDKKDLPKLVGIGALMVTLNISLFYQGIMRTTTLSASALTMTIPLFSVLGGWWILKEKVYSANLIGIILGVVGALIIIGLPLTLLGLPSSPTALLGNSLIVLASVSWVVGAIISKEMAKKYSTLLLTAVIFLVGTLSFLLPAANEYIQNPSWPSQITIIGISGLIFIAIASSICAYFLFEWGLRKLGVIKANIFQYIEPLITATLGVIILSEDIRFSFIIGAILIGLGVYWSTLLKEQHQYHKAHRI